MLCVQRCSDVGPAAGSVVSYFIAESPKQGSIRFISISKTIQFAHIIILVIYALDLNIVFAEQPKYLG